MQLSNDLAKAVTASTCARRRCAGPGCSDSSDNGSAVAAAAPTLPRIRTRAALAGSRLSVATHVNSPTAAAAAAARGAAASPPATVAAAADPSTGVNMTPSSILRRDLSVAHQLAHIAGEPQFAELAAHIEHSCELVCGGSARLAATAALLAATAALQTVQPVSPPLSSAYALGNAAHIAQQALLLASERIGAGTPAAADFPGAMLPLPVPLTSQPSSSASPCCAPLHMPMQALLELLERDPGRVRAAFLAHTAAAADPASPSFALAPRHSLLPWGALPALLAEAMPAWPAALAEYAARQVGWHSNVVAWDGSGGGGGGGGDLLYAELAAAVIAAAETEAAAAAPYLVPGARELALAVARAAASADGAPAFKGPFSVADAATELLAVVAASAEAPSPRRALRLRRSSEGAVAAAVDGGRAAAWLAAALLPLAGSSRLSSVSALQAAAAELAERCCAATSPLLHHHHHHHHHLLPANLSPTMAAMVAYRRQALHTHSSGGVSGGDSGRAVHAHAWPWRGAVSATCSADIEHAAAAADILVLE